jgi:amino acid transporter
VKGSRAWPRRAGSSLRRDIGILDKFAFAYGDISEGIYFTLGIVLVYANAAATYAYIFATIAYVLTALCYAELSGAYHEAGGAFTFASRAFGRNIAFLAAWALLLDYLVTTAISAVAAAGYIGYFFPLLSNVATVVTVAIVVGLLVLNVFGIAGSARFSYVLVLFDIVGEAIVLTIGFVFSYHPAINQPPARKPSTARTMSIASSLTLPEATKATTPTMTVRIGVVSARAADSVGWSVKGVPSDVAPNAIARIPPIRRMAGASEYASSWFIFSFSPP